MRLALIETYRTFTLEYAGFTIALVVGLVTELTQVLPFFKAGPIARGFIVAVIFATIGLGFIGFFQSSYWGRYAETAISNPPEVTHKKFGNDPLNTMNAIYGEKLYAKHPRYEGFANTPILLRFAVIGALSLALGFIAMLL